mmetsp:Transcript_68641/g.128040  ORF Transcript_68641/g.128040 Transcript_68641/m.128040 type:complete len:251 (-) Transcript_68641:80-832(-)
MGRALALVPIAVLAGCISCIGLQTSRSLHERDSSHMVFVQPGVTGSMMPARPHAGMVSHARLAGHPSRSGASTAILFTAALAVSASLLRHSLVARQADERRGWRIHGAPGRPGTPYWKIPDVRWCKRFKNRIAVRKHIEGTCARPRLAVFRSRQHIHVNVVDDTVGTGVTLVASDSKQAHNLEALREKSGCSKGDEKTWSYLAAEVVGADIAKKCLENDITQVVFDHGGFKYTGRVKSLAEAARAGGLTF